MPELPEVETVCRELRKKILNKKISDINIKEEKFIKNMDVNTFVNQLTDQKITDIRRIGKYILFDFEKNTLVSHLRMEGKYFYSSEITELEKHDYIGFYFTDNTWLKYNDTRKFGTLELVEYKKELSLKSIDKLGMEANDPELSKLYIVKKAKNKKTTIKQFLLDQTIITGLGNIYVDEVLFASKIHPLTKVYKLNDEKFDIIIKNSKKILDLAIKNGGSTIKSFKISSDMIGSNQDFLNVYARKDEPCNICLEKIQKIKVGGRGTHFCPNCQKEDV